MNDLGRQKRNKYKVSRPFMDLVKGNMSSDVGIEPELCRMLYRIQKSTAISNYNKMLMLRFLTHLQAMSLKLRTKLQYLYTLSKLLPMFTCNADMLRKHELESIMALVNAQHLQAQAVRKLKVQLKAFLKWCMPKDRYDANIAWLKLGPTHLSKVLPHELLTAEDVAHYIRVAQSKRNKAIIALFYDAALSPQEMSGLRVRDLMLGTSPPHVVIEEGKTEYRAGQVPLTFSCVYLMDYLKDRGDAEPDDPLWLAEGTWTYLRHQMSAAAIRKAVHEIAKASFIKKHVWPYLFRHSRLTHLAKEFNRYELTKFGRWAPGSNMADNYVHLAGKDIDEAIISYTQKRQREMRLLLPSDAAATQNE